MKHAVKFFLFSLLILTLNSCEKDEDKKPDISFKTGASYTSSDVTLAGGTVATIGILAEKTEEEDVLTHFNVAISVNGLAAVSVFDEEIAAADEDIYDYDFTYAVPVGPGITYKLTFTVTDRDGQTNQVSLTVTAS
jgi:hypothetical protein